MQNLSFSVILILFYSCASITSHNSQSRIRAVNKISEENHLKQIAINDDCDLVAKSAIDKIRNQEYLGEIVLKRDKTFGDKSNEYALEKISDQHILMSVAIRSKEIYLRNKAINKITNDSILCEIALKCYYERTALSVINKITDISYFYKIIDNGNEEHLKRIVSATNDEYVILEIIKSGKLGGISLDDAINKINSQDLLKEIYQSKTTGFARAKAVAKINDQKYIEDNVLNEKNGIVKEKMLYKVRNQDIIKYIAINDSRKSTRITAIQRIYSNSDLYQIYHNEESKKIKDEIIKKISDENILKQIIEDEEGGNVRAVQKIKSQEILLNIFIEKKNLYAFRKLNPISLTKLRQIIQEEDILLAIEILLEEVNVDSLFEHSLECESTGKILRAIYYSKKYPSKKNDIKKACLFSIKCGKKNDIGVLKEMLWYIDEKDFSLTYLNCGNNSLEQSAKSWARQRNYDVIYNNKQQSNVRWGN